MCLELAQIFGRMRSIEVETESIPAEVTSQLFTLCNGLEHLDIQSEINRNQIVVIITMKPKLKTLGVKFDDLGPSQIDCEASDCLKALTDNCPDIESMWMNLSGAPLLCEDDVGFEVVTPCHEAQGGGDKRLFQAFYSGHKVVLKVCT